MQALNGIERVVAAVELLARAETPMRLSDIAQKLAIPKSAVHRILVGLETQGWVEQAASECYALTLRMPMLGQHLLAQFGESDLRQPILDRLASRTRELVRLTAVRNEALVWIGVARGRRSGLVYEADMTAPVVPFATANGKAWLATLKPADAVRIARAAGLGARPDLPRAVASKSALLAELERTRARGHGLSMEEAEPGVAAIAITIGDGQSIVGTMSVAAPIGRLGPERIAEVLPALRQAASSMMLVWHRHGEGPLP